MKHMKLIALLAAAMMVQGAQASSKMDDAKKIGKITLHTAKICAAAAGAVMYAMGMEDSDGNIEWPWQQEKKAAKVLCFVHWFGVGVLLHDGVQGLNHELKIVERAKKLTDRIMKKKK